jgi:plasmid stability protein
MALQPITIRLPKTVYQHVVQRASKMHRSVEDELVAVVTAALPNLGDIPADIANDMAQLSFLTDKELWQIARTTLTSQEAEQMQALTWKRQREGLTAAEQQETEQLLQRYNRIMLVRAKAAVLLKERGHDVSTLLSESSTAE